MIERLMPAAVVAVEAFEDPPDLVLFPEEEAVLARAVEKRRREFSTVRLCARDALAQLGFAPAPLLPGQRGAPQWPDGVVGSMTHCAGYRAAAVARDREVVTIGIDAEPHEPLPAGVMDVIALPEELESMRRLAGAAPELCWDRLLFSAKESVYKAWFPLTRRWLDFAEAVIAFDPATGQFTGQLKVSGPVVAGREISAFRGRWLVSQGLVLTAIVVTAPEL